MDKLANDMHAPLKYKTLSNTVNNIVCRTWCDPPLLHLPPPWAPPAGYLLSFWWCWRKARGTSILVIILFLLSSGTILKEYIKSFVLCWIIQMSHLSSHMGAEDLPLIWERSSYCTVPNWVPLRVPGSPRGPFCRFGSPLGLLFCLKVPFFSILG